ncbi:hypothetical protein [Lentzea sp. NPDC003310]
MTDRSYEDGRLVVRRQVVRCDRPREIGLTWETSGGVTEVLR